jgi:hypothetical protein
MNRVTSRYKIFGGFGLLILLNAVIGLGTYKLLTSSKISIDKVDLWHDANAQYAYAIIIGLQFLLLLLFATQNRFISADTRGITFINPLLPFLRKTTLWTDFDYYISVEEQSKHTTYEAVWLVKNDKLSARFSSFYYSNYNELKKQIRAEKGKNRYFNPIEQFLILLGLRKIKIK